MAAIPRFWRELLILWKISEMITFKKRKRSISLKKCFILLSTFLCLSPIAWADDAIEDFWNDTKISGDIRAYDFYRDYSNKYKFDQSAFSLGGKLGIVTGSLLEDFRLGATFYTLQSLGLNNHNINRVDTTLLPGDDVNTLGEAYLQYARHQFLIRVGDQLINTPWLNAADSRMIPATYRGAFTTFQPNQDWTFTALRIIDFKSRASNDFSATTVYNPQNQGISIPGLASVTTPGAQAVGANYQTDSLSGQIWGYQFFDYAKLGYLDMQYAFKNTSHVQPFIGGQFLTQGEDGKNDLSIYAKGKANATGYGAITGIQMPNGKVSVSYNRLIVNQNAFNNGNVVSPYTFTSDPLYTTSMIAGLVDKTAGDAWKIAGTVYAFDQQLQITASFAQYFTQPYLANTDETDLDVTYAFKKSSHKTLRGLSLRNRFGVLTGDPTKGTFLFNRVMLQYDF